MITRLHSGGGTTYKKQPTQVLRSTAPAQRTTALKAKTPVATRPATNYGLDLVNNRMNAIKQAQTPQPAQPPAQTGNNTYDLLNNRMHNLQQAQAPKAGSTTTGGNTYKPPATSSPASASTVNNWVDSMRATTQQNAAFDNSATTNAVEALRKQLYSGPSSPNLPAQINLDNYKTELATIQDLAEKYGFDYSREYAERQAAILAQAQRDEIEAARARQQYETESAQTDLDHDFFQQYLEQRQSLADSGLNAGIASERDLRLEMSRQYALADILANQQLSNQEMDAALRRITAEELTYAEQLYQQRMQQGFSNAMDMSRFVQSENQFQANAAMQQRAQQVEEAWRAFEFNNMSEADKQRMLQNERQFGTEMAWRQYEFNNMSAAEKAKLAADAERFGMEMAWERHRFEAGMAFEAGQSSFNTSGGGGGANFTSFRQTSSFGTRTDPITGKKGSNHAGNDYAMPVGTPIQSNVSGKVIRAGASGSGWGNYVVIQDSKGNAHIYAHLSKANVKVGQTVKPGQVVAASGNSGRSTGPHLHYEVRKGGLSGTPINPNSFL